MDTPLAAASNSVARTSTISVAILGNPNTGKSTLFNALSGLRQRVGNYPGVTVEKKTGTLHDALGRVELIDLPGTYSLAPRSPDEMLAVDVLLGTHFSTGGNEPRPQVLLSVVDASNLERNLFLTTQLMDVGLPVVIALTMVDLAEAKGQVVNATKLSDRLGVPVIAVNALKRTGLKELIQALRDVTQDETSRPAPVRFPPVFADEAQGIGEFLRVHVPQAAVQLHLEFLVRRLLIDVGGITEAKVIAIAGPDLRQQLKTARSRLDSAGCPVPAIEAKTRYAWIREKAGGCVERTPKMGKDWTARLDAVLTHRVWGLIIFLTLMFIVFQSIFTWARPLMDAIDAGKTWLGNIVVDHMSPGPLRSLLTKGMLEGVGGVLIFLPQIIILFFFIAILEDCGYMARAAYLMDKVMARCGLSGKSFIPLLSSFACAIPGIMAARVIEDRRDRLATILVAPLMSCAARLPVYLLLAGAFLGGFGWWVPGLAIFGMYLLGLIVAPLVAGTLKRTLLRGDTPVFILEMPSYKWPSWRLVLHRMLDRGWAFVYRAGTIILASMVLVWALVYFPATDAAGRSYDRQLAALEDQVTTVQTKLDEIPDHPEHQAERAALTAKKTQLDEDQKALLTEWRTHSFLGRLGQWTEPVVRPLGWDWRIGMAALASFPAREVVVGTLGIIYNEGEIDTKSEEARASLAERLKEARWDAGSSKAGQPVFTVPVALSVMVFFVFCCQCASTLAVLKRETNSWRWPLFAFSYMTVLAYAAALGTYQLGTLLL